MEKKMSNDEALGRALSQALLVLRVTLGLFLLQWGVEKFVMPQNTVTIGGSSTV
jgi:putative oxidoreductase